MAESYKKSGARDMFESLIVTVVLAIFGTTFIIQAFKIPTGSMETTLLIGDHLLVNKFAFAHPRGPWERVLPYRQIHRGDIVVFRPPAGNEEASQEAGEHLVKRIIGVPGDRIRIVHRQVYVNGQPLQEPYVHHEFLDQDRPGDDFPPTHDEYLPGATLRWSENLANYVKAGELVVPPEQYFAMGDNRENSWDGRFWGFVPAELIKGRPLMIYWSFETARDEYMQTSLGDRLRQTGNLIIHFFDKTRWRRTFRLVR